MATASSSPPPSKSEAEVKEAEQYWGYLISADRTGTDKLKRLLGGLHSLISSTFDVYDSSDLTPSQLASFYKACDGEYDQLFHNTPPADIAYIYKNLGCVHSLQPRRSSFAGSKYSDPVIPALKVEGWITWSTIQLLLAPHEHAEFLQKALLKWDVRVPGSHNEIFPKMLPRSCLPPGPDPTMQAWYDGMTERLRKEIEDDVGIRVKPIGDDDARSDSPNHRHHHQQQQQQRIRHIPHPYDSDDDNEASDGHKSDALAYFRNPLFRTVDGLKKGASKRPALDPRNSSFVQRGKFAAATVGRVVQNVASPHLWNGGNKPHASTTSTGSPDGVTELPHRGRRSLPDKHRYQDEYSSPSSSQASPTLPNSRGHDRLSARRGSYQPDTHNYWSGPGPVPAGDDATRHAQPSHRQHVSPDLRHRRSHDPPASPREYSREYFPPPPSAFTPVPTTSSENTPPPSSSRHGTHRRASSMQTGPRSHSPAGTGAGFGPSVSPLFATHIARGEPSAYTQPYSSSYSYRAPSQSRPPLQRRTDYRSPERSGTAAGAGTSRPGSGQREHWDVGEGSDVGMGAMRRSESSGNFGRVGRMGKKGPRSLGGGVGGGGGGGSKYGMGIGGVDGRRYTVQGGDSASRRGR